MTGVARRPALPLALGGLLVAATALRFATLGAQSFWYDEAFTPVHVLRAGLGTTLHEIVRSENAPPLWYLFAWAVSRLFGTGEVALRSISALAGLATVPLAWGIGHELGGRRTATTLAALVAVNPLFVWYSQEARFYGVFVAAAALAFLLFLRAERAPSPGRLAAWVAASLLALLVHYFALFLIAPQALWLLHRSGRRAFAAVAATAAAGLALLPLVLAQGGHGTQWIGRWALSSRLEAIPQYWLTGPSAAPLGHAIELAVALVPLAALALFAPRLDDAQRRAALLCAAIGAAAIAAPLALALFGADYLAPRNVIAAWIPLTAALAVLLTAHRAGPALAAVLAVGWLVLTVDVALSPRLQRGDWRAVATLLQSGGPPRAVVTPELGVAPLQYYRGLKVRRPRGTISVQEVDLVGYAPLTATAGRPPAPGFAPAGRHSIHGLWLYRFLAPAPKAVSVALLRARSITRASPEVLVP